MRWEECVERIQHVGLKIWMAMKVNRKIILKYKLARHWSKCVKIPPFYRFPKLACRLGVNKFSTKKKKTRNHLKVLGVRKVTWSVFHIEHPQILGATAENLASTATWLPWFVDLSCTYFVGLPGWWSQSATRSLTREDNTNTVWEIWQTIKTSNQLPNW